LLYNQLPIEVAPDFGSINNHAKTCGWGVTEGVKLTLGVLVGVKVLVSEGVGVNCVCVFEGVTFGVEVLVGVIDWVGVIVGVGVGKTQVYVETYSQDVLSIILIRTDGL